MMKVEQTYERNTGWALASLALSMLLSSLGVSIANVALPTLAEAFGASYAAVQWVVLAYLLSLTTLIVGAGRLGDLLGHRRLLLAGLGIFTFAALLCGLALSIGWLIAARMLQGTGAAVLMAVTVALVREMVPKEKTGSAMGLLGTTSAIGTALGPSLGGVLIAGLGWRAVFFVMVPLGLVNLLLAWLFLPAATEAKRFDKRRFDVVGTAVFGVAIAAYALAVTLDQATLWLGLIAALALGLFVIVEQRVAAPLIQLALLRNRALGSSLVMNALVATVMMATLVVGPFFLARTLALSPAQAGFAMSVGPLVSTLTGIPSGKLVDRLGPQAVVVIGLAVMALGAIALALLPVMFGLGGYIAAMLLLTPGYQLFQAANNTAVMLDVAPERRGVVSGMLSLARNLGLVTGASVMGAVFAAAADTHDMAAAGGAAVAMGLQVTFAVATGLVLVALGIAVFSSLHRRA